MRLPDATGALLTDASRFRRCPGPPLGCVGGVLLRGFPDHFLHFGRCDRRRAARPRSILLQTGQAHLQEPLSPPSRLLVANADFGGDLENDLVLTKAHWAY
jgi:hypothetical protein